MLPIKAGKIFILIALLLSASVYADGYEEEDEYEEDEGSEGLGSAAAFLLFLGLLHSAFKYLAPYLNVDRKKITEIRIKYVFHHGAVMVIATALALLHHFSSEREILAYPALIFMVWLSITGVIMRYSISTESKRYASMMHFQRLFTALLLVSLFLHLSVGGD